MNDVVKVLTLLVAAGIVTSLILPGRQTPQVVKSFGDVFTGAIATATGQPRR